MINKVVGIHQRDETEDYTKCIEAQEYYLDGLTMGVHFSGRRIFLYDLSNLIEGISFVQKTFPEHVLPIDSMLLENGLLTIKWRPCTIYIPCENHSIEKDDVLYMGHESHKYFTNTRYKRPDPTATIIFPPAETNAEWKDRMHRTLAFCAHQIEDALSTISPLLYQRSDDAHTASITTQDRIRIANVSMHARLNIGYLWHQVITAVNELLSTKPKKSVVEGYIKKVYENMKTPEHIKAFFHNHDTEEWRKLRHQSADDRNNHRRIHIWDTDFTAGDLLLDVNLKNTTNGVLNDLEARSDFHTCATADYKLAASSPNWELVTERIY